MNSGTKFFWNKKVLFGLNYIMGQKKCETKNNKKVLEIKSKNIYTHEYREWDFKV